MPEGVERMRPGFFYYRRWFNRRGLLHVVTFGSIVLALSALILTTAHFRPILESLATTRVSFIVNSIISQAVQEAIDNGEISYEKLVSFEKDYEGRITAVHSNMVACNRLQSEILDIILTRIDQVPPQDLSISIGSLSGSVFLSGRGPQISVRMESVGSSSAWFENEFVSAGINQTKHQIILNVEVYVSILLPGFTADTEISNAVTVAETIIVGSVPDTYTYFATDPSRYDEYILSTN